MENYPSIKPSEMAQIMVFRLLWTSLPKKSFLTGLWLRNFENTPFFRSCFAHVLAKGQNKYPYFKTYTKNIVLLTPNEHHLWDNGTAEARISYSQEVEKQSGGKTKANWAGLEALAEELRGEYKKYFPTRRGLIIGYKYNLEEIQKIIGMLNAKYMDELKNNLSLDKTKPDE